MHEARHAFRAELQANRQSALDRVEIRFDDYRAEWVFRLCFSSGYDRYFSIDDRVIGDLSGADHAYFDQLLRRQWSRAVAEHTAELQLQPYRRAIMRLYELDVPRWTIAEAEANLAQLQDRLRRQVEETLAPPGYHFGIDYGTDYGVSPAMLTAAHVRRAQDALRENEHARDQASKKALKLLREWLSPEQLVTFDKDQTFQVVGGSSGKRYRIRWGTTYNIDELDEEGRPAESLCFAPVGQHGMLAIGDVLLGQKLALESFEEAAIKVANRRSNRGLGPVWFEEAGTFDLRPGMINRLQV